MSASKFRFIWWKFYGIWTTGSIDIALKPLSKKHNFLSSICKHPFKLKDEFYWNDVVDLHWQRRVKITIHEMCVCCDMVFCPYNCSVLQKHQVCYTKMHRNKFPIAWCKYYCIILRNENLFFISTQVLPINRNFDIYPLIYLQNI